MIMITGDSAQTAAAIARDVHILGADEPSDGRVFIGGASGGAWGMCMASVAWA